MDRVESIIQDRAWLRLGKHDGDLKVWAPSDTATLGEVKYPRVWAIARWALPGGLLLCLALSFCPSFVQALTGGAILAFVGSAGSQVLQEWKDNKWLRWLRGVCIGMFVTGGMLLAAYGWNLRSSHLETRACLRAVASELDLNQVYIEQLSLAHQKYKVTGNPDAMTALPLPSTYLIRQVLASSSICMKDPEFADAVFIYVIAADSLAASLEKIDLVCSSHIVSAEMAKTVVDSAFGDGRMFRGFRDQHKRFAGQLVAKYDWCFMAGKRRMRKPVLDDFYRNVVGPAQMQLTDLDHRQRMKRLRDALEATGRLIPHPNNSASSGSGEDPNR